MSDADTGLMWHGCPAGETGTDCALGEPTLRDWHDALQYCEVSTWGGYDDWYLPNVIELLSIVDASLTGSAFDADAFLGTPTSVAFMSSTSRQVSATVWTVDYGNGSNTATGKGSLLATRCVRQE